MAGQASRARNAAKCARCGHPRAKHTTNPADGCTVKVRAPGRYTRDRFRQAFTSCPCRYFMEGQS